MSLPCAIAGFGILTAHLPGDDKKIAERDAALAEADRKAFEKNMATYASEVKPFLESHCISCHGPEKQKGDLALDGLDPDMKKSSSASRWAAVREALEFEEMPPEDEPRPRPAQVVAVLDWIKAEMKRARRNFTRREQILHGNKMSHAKLFDASFTSELDNPPRVRRQSPEIYERFRKDMAKGFEELVTNPFSTHSQFVFRDMGTPKLDEPTSAQLLTNAITIVKRQTGHKMENGQLKPIAGTKKDFLDFIDPKKPLGRAEMERAVRLEFRYVLEREASTEELERFVALMEKNVREAGRLSGVRYSLAAVFLLPEAIFRWEVGGSPDEAGLARLRPQEIAHALAYTLGDGKPPAWLVQSADKGDLDSEAGVIATVERLLDDKKFDHSRILRFFREFFEYDKAIDVFKESKDFSAHRASQLIHDTDLLVRWILDRDRDVIRELLTTNRSFVNARIDSKTGEIVQADTGRLIHLSYSLPPDWKWTSQQPLEMPNTTRAGILTQPSWLVAWSMSEDNHAILRGKWIRERLLGNIVPDIPITVDAQLPEEPEWTLRERMKVTEEEYCWQCHKLMNDVGLPFENFDHFGRWRARELNQPVDASGKINLTGDPRIDGTETENAIDFVHALGGSERVEQVFIRHAFRYFLGRNENLGDARTLRNAQAAYRDNGGSFRALVISLLSSDSFLFRTPDGEGAKVARKESYAGRPRDNVID